MREEAESKTWEPIPLNCPTPCLKVAPLRLEERTLQGPGGKQTKKPQEASQLSRVCHRPCSRVRTAGDRGCSSLAEPLANPQLAELAPPGSPSARSSQHPGHLARVLLHRLFPDFSLEQLLRDLVSSPFHSPLQSDLYDNKQVSPYWSSWRALLSTLRIQAQGVQSECHTQ